LRTKVLVLTQNSFPPDVRVEKEVTSLISAGFEVMVVASRKATSKKVVQFGSARVVYAWMTFPAGIPMLNFRWLFKIARDFKPEVIQVCDTPLGLVAYLLSRLLGVKLVFDAHEIWPLFAIYGLPNRFHSLISSPTFFATEEVLVHVSQAVITASNGIASYFASYYHCPPSRITVVKNVPGSSELNAPGLESHRESLPGYLVVFVGGTNVRYVQRELGRFVKAIGLLKGTEEGRGLMLRIVGGQPDALVSLSRELGVSDQVEFVPWVPLHEAFARIREADLCIVALEKNPCTDTVFPHKLLQYVSLRRPVLSARLTEIVGVVGDQISYYERSDPEAIARAVSEARDHKGELLEKASRLGESIGKELIWDKEEERYLSVFRKLHP
jgi:glycosyltransferase involved in cell wall biosynthesis